MRIHAHILAWNEEVQLPVTLRHYAKFCEKIYIYDNESTDKTREIALNHPKTEVLEYSSDNRFNDWSNICVKNNAWKTSIDIADWVIVVDCDELVWHPDIHAYLEKKKAENVTVISPQWWNMVGTDLPGEENEIPIGQPHPFGKPVLFDPNSVLEINYGVGAHSCNPKGYIQQIIDNEIKTLHYKHHSIEYVLARYATYRARMSDLNRQAHWGHHYDEEDATHRENYIDLLSKCQELPQ